MIERTKTTRGSGMTRRRYVRTNYRIPEDLPMMIEDSKADPTYEEWLKNLMEFCQKRLRVSGFPDTIFVRKGSTIKQQIDEYVIEQPSQDEDTDAGFAARNLWHAHNALQLSTQKDLWRFASQEVARFV
jgi:hypothetical protein